MVLHRDVAFMVSGVSPADWFQHSKQAGLKVDWVSVPAFSNMRLRQSCLL